MCGIAGCYQQPDSHRLTRVMSEAIAHRGPDASGQYAFKAEGLSADVAHRRLAIIDLSDAANQPFVKDGLVLSYNGELFNYRELREQLRAAGTTFRTDSDTEVVLEAWRRWGSNCLERFRGMFAFALLDERTGSLVLARDHLGIKPLFYLRRGRGVLFASELKALVAAVGPELQVDAGALVASMLYYWIPEQRCAVKDVRKLPPGCWAEVRPTGEVTVHQHWDIAAAAAEAAAGPPIDLRGVLEESVQAHLVSDVPVSTFLSGGLDSSIVTVLAKRHAPEVDAYTITFRAADQRMEAMPDDALYARKVAAQFGLTLHEVQLDPDVASTLPRMAEILDEPIGDPAAINTFLICQAAREAGVKVLLSGMGADELFGGYRKHLACLLGARYRGLPGFLRERLIRPTADRIPVAIGGRGLRRARWAKRFLTFAELPEEPAFRRSYSLYDEDELAGLLDPDVAGEVLPILEEHAEIYNDSALTDHVNRMCLADARMFLPSLNLSYTDRASMAASTEVRVPFVDRHVVTAAFSLTGAEKISGRTGKKALKSVAREWLPDEIVFRPKAAFGAPLRAWIRRDLRAMVDEVLLDGDLVRSGFLRAAEVRRLVEEDRSGREDRSKQIWQLLTLELWNEQVRSRGVRS